MALVYEFSDALKLVFDQNNVMKEFGICANPSADKAILMRYYEDKNLVNRYHELEQNEFGFICNLDDPYNDHLVLTLKSTTLPNGLVTFLIPGMKTYQQEGVDFIKEMKTVLPEEFHAGLEEELGLCLAKIEIMDHVKKNQLKDNSKLN